MELNCIMILTVTFLENRIADKWAFNEFLHLTRWRFLKELDNTATLPWVIAVFLLSTCCIVRHHQSSTPRESIGH